MQLQMLYFFYNITWNTLTEISVANNLIMNIDVFEKFVSLKHINAEHNHIEECRLQLGKLETLNLAHNQLSAFPIFTNCDKLRELNLSHNNIETMDNFSPIQVKVLKILNMSHN